MRTLTLTSPLTQGTEVGRAQKILAGKNIFEADYLRDVVDGVFGEATGRACIRAKFWLGYPTRELRPTYGDIVDGLLTGKRELPAEYRKRRTARQKAAEAAAKRKTLGEKMLDVLAPDVGLTENPPGSNWTKFNAAYRLSPKHQGMRGPWCAMCVSYAGVKAGSTAFKLGARWAYVPYLLGDARAGRYGLQVVRLELVRAGDLFCVDWQRGSGRNVYDFDHVGMVRRKPAGGSFLTREGNTSFDRRGSQSNGGALADRERELNDGRFVFLRVGR